MAKSVTGICRICGVSGPLTFEHVPPKAAGNEPYGIGLDVQRYLEDGPDAHPSEMRRQKLPRGSGGYYLCGQCNSVTGARYVPSYVTWVEQGERHRAALGDRNSIALPFHIFPARVFKQILSIFAATCGDGLFAAHPVLRKLVLDYHAQGMPDGLRVFCYIVHPDSLYSRQSGIVGMMDLGGRSHTLAEFAFRPFGYLLTLGGTPPPDTGLFDITFFAQAATNEYRDLHLPLPIRPVESYLPADFRSKAEWAAAIEEAYTDKNKGSA
jgi:hypothetical protein